MRCWLFFPVLVLAASDSTCEEPEVSELLQASAGRIQPDRSPAGLKDLAARLVKAKQECLVSSMECLPALKQVRYRVWPYVTHLIHWPHKAWEPMDFHPQVVRAQMDCNGDKNYTIFLMHMWKSAGWPLMENLKAVSLSSDTVEAFEDDFNWCDKLNLTSLDSKHRSTFTFVREPLSRLISGYAEIERTYKGGRYDFLKQAEEGTVKRAKIFMDRYFEDGALYNGHVKPQSEYFAPFSSDCRLPIDFIGRTEKLEEDWKEFLESRQCTAAEKPFSEELGQHPTDGVHKDAITRLFDEVNQINLNRVSLLSVGSTTNSATARAAVSLRKVLENEDFAYLRAFCWLLLSDYVMFDYDLPDKCNDPEMLEIVRMTKATAVP
eukprot:Skav218837  [mRNA]  locus=scaffold3029:90342:100579:- [translate_table: standard]